MKEKYCPLTKVKCICNKCAWYMYLTNECAIKSLAMGMEDINYNTKEKDAVRMHS